MRTSLIVVFAVAFAAVLHAQPDTPAGLLAARQPAGPSGVESFVLEKFEGEQFPPPGWALEYAGALYWGRLVGASGYGGGTAAAVFQNYWAPTNTTQALVIATMGPTQLGDSLRFDHAYATFENEIDRLVIEVSNSGGASYTTLETLYGGVSGELVTAPPRMTQFVPGASQWATKQYALPRGTNRVRFKAISGYGNYLYLDNCTIGGRAVVDVGAVSIDVSNPTVSLPQTPRATFKNHGASPQAFMVTCAITPGGYASTRSVATLPADTAVQVSFDQWTPPAGSYDVTVFTTLAGDVDPTNDTLKATIVVNQTQVVTNLSATFRDGQVFATWDNLPRSNVVYTLYRSPQPIQAGQQLGSAQNLGNVRDSSSLNRRLTLLSGGTAKYLKIDSAGSPLGAGTGLFVATSTGSGSFYYALTAGTPGIEDTTIVTGSNSLVSPIEESVMMPKPVWQESRTVGGRPFNVYVQFATGVTSSLYPSMTNAGSYPFHFALVKSGAETPHPLRVWLHGQTGSFLGNQVFRHVGDPNEWVIAIDDWLPNVEFCTHYYGYHAGYDIHSDLNPVPVSGILHDYTAARVAHTIEWAGRNLPVDSTRVYLTGMSMGAYGSIFAALTFPEKIAAIFIFGPEFDLAKWDDLLATRLWGTSQGNLLTNSGQRRNERLNAGFLTGANRLVSLPVLYTFCGKNDINVGWAEKIPFYDSLRAARHGGFHFWSMSDHWGSFLNSPWQPTFPNTSILTRYRTNLSYPAFTNCSIDDDPGDGSPSNGDPLGTINGHLDWDDDIVDRTDMWEITLRLKDLSTTFGPDIAPDSATTDVTLRRLQVFSVPRGHRVNWDNRRNGSLVQQSSFLHDSGLVTISGVKVYKDSSRLAVWHTPVSVVTSNPLLRSFTLAQNYPNPFNPSTTICYGLPHKTTVQLSVFNTLGQQVATLVQGEQEAGYHEVKFDGSKLASGVYLYRLQAGSYLETKKLLVCR